MLWQGFATYPDEQAKMADFEVRRAAIEARSDLGPPKKKQ